MTRSALCCFCQEEKEVGFCCRLLLCCVPFCCVLCVVFCRPYCIYVWGLVTAAEGEDEDASGGRESEGPEDQGYQEVVRQKAMLMIMMLWGWTVAVFYAVLCVISSVPSCCYDGAKMEQNVRLTRDKPLTGPFLQDLPEPVRGPNEEVRKRGPIALSTWPSNLRNETDRSAGMESLVDQRAKLKKECRSC